MGGHPHVLMNLCPGSGNCQLGLQRPTFLRDYSVEVRGQDEGSMPPNNCNYEPLQMRNRRCMADAKSILRC